MLFEKWLYCARVVTAHIWTTVARVVNTEGFEEKPHSDNNVWLGTPTSG